MARAVVDALQQQLVGWVPGELQPQHVLCMMCPAAVGVEGARAPHKGVWRVVCLAAVNAMDVGRRAANKQRVEQREQQQAAAAAQQQQAARVSPDQQFIDELLQPATLSDVQQQHQVGVRQRQQQRQQQEQQAAAARLDAVKQQAVARFWELLQDFVALHVAPESWLPELDPDHPFLRGDGDRLVVHCVAPPAPGAA